MPPPTETNFVCDCSDSARSACQGEPFFKEHEGKRYCVLHYPAKDKIEPFRVALNRKLKAKDFNFCGVWFPEVADFRHQTFNHYANFSSANFSAHVNFINCKFSAKVSFSSATFSGSAEFHGTQFSAYTRFSNARFNSFAGFAETTFSDYTDFTLTTFSNISRFDKATFNAHAIFHGSSFCEQVSFNTAIFADYITFMGATFQGSASFSDTTFSNAVIFVRATFSNYVHFSKTTKEKQLRETPQMSFHFVHFEKPERVSFHTLNLRPSWFVNVDSRKLEFTDVEFKYVLKDEFKSLEGIVGAGHRLLAIACRQLADNAEVNHRYHEASRLRYSAFEARRIEKFRGFVPWRLDWWYWLASGYGERVLRAFIVFALLLGIFAYGYKSAEFEPPSKPAVTSQPPDPVEPKPKTMGWREAALYSFKVAILQKPEPKPRGLWSDLLVSLETVLGPAQAALLALALRRRFMR